MLAFGWLCIENVSVREFRRTPKEGVADNRLELFGGWAGMILLTAFPSELGHTPVLCAGPSLMARALAYTCGQLSDWEIPCGIEGRGQPFWD